VPYGCALLKLYAGSMKKPLDGFFVVQETGPRREVGDEAVEPGFDATSYSVSRQASEQ
jgi:hypothetical protein